jgi:DNA helicase-2/ATP-dependent DNA helicase PcrA
MYVATTRAKENLFIIYPMQAYDRASGITFCQPSRFVDGIPEHILQRQSVGRTYAQRAYIYDDFHS